MKKEVLISRARDSLVAFVLFLNGILFFAYRVPQNSYFPAHDYLDHLFVLYKLRGESPFFFDYSAALFGVLGKIPLSSLGISDFSLDANIFVVFEAPLAAVLNEFISRNIAFLGMYVFLLKFMPTAKSKYVLLAPSLLFSLLPYYPNFQLTIAFLPVIAYVVLLSMSAPLTPFRIFLIISASLFGNFTYGGFAVLGVVLILIVVQLSKGEIRTSSRLLAIALILSAGYIAGISRILFLKFTTGFHSHRISWKPVTENWFDLTYTPKLFFEFTNITLKGHYHFPSGQSVFSNLFIPGIPLILLLIYLGLQIRFIAQKIPMLGSELQEFRLIKFLLCVILLLNLFYSSEASGFTHFENLLEEPFQFKRAAILLPFVWCVLTAVVLSATTRHFPKIAAVSLLLLVVQVSVSNLGIQQQILHYTGLGGSRVTIGEYFESDTYSGLARKVNRDPGKIRVVSFDLDPMVASYNGYDSLDGYVYNYPLEYKVAFRKIIAGELEADKSLKDYYDGWGSRVYLFHRNLPVKEIRFDWCAARDLGAEFVLSKENLSPVSNLQFTGKNNDLLLYKISGCLQ